MTLHRHRPFRRVFDLRRLFGDRKAIDEELAFHLEEAVDRLVADGWALEDARREAARRFGDVDAVRNACRDIGRQRTRRERVTEAIDTLSTNLRLGWRQLRRSPATTTAALASLVAGIGAATALYSVAHATLVEPLPFESPDRLVRVFSTRVDINDMQASAADFLDWQSQSTAFEDLAAVGFASLALTDRQPPQRLNIAKVSASFFDVLGRQPRLGRAFSAGEDRPGGQNEVAILSDRLWRSRFAADNSIIGRAIDLDGQRFTVIGVMPPDFAMPEWSDLWVPLAPDPMAERDDHELDVIGRVAAGVTIQSAEADLERVAAGLAERYPDSNEGWSIRLVRFDDWLIGAGFRRTLGVLLAAVGCLVLLAAVNVANVLLARGLARGHELALRTAIGAGRGRLIGQLLTEGLLLAMLGGVGGVLAAFGLIELLRRLEPGWIPRLDAVTVDLPVLAFAGLLTVATGLVFALLPALHATGRGLNRALVSGGRGLASEGRRTRGALVAIEVAVATLLLVGAGLLFDTFLRLDQVDPGFDPSPVLEARLQLPPHRYSWEARGEAAPRLADAIAAIPGIERVSFSNVAPFGAFHPTNLLRVVGDASGESLMSDWRAVSPDYFATLGIPILRGRAFEDSDDGDAMRVIIVSRSMADTLWPDGDAIGGQIDWGSPGGRPLTVVGVAGDVRDLDLRTDRWTLYLPHRQLSWASLSMMIRTELPREAIAEDIRAAIWRIDPDLPVPTIEPLESSRTAAIAGPTTAMAMLIAFAAIALILAASGIFGLTIFAVERRQREIGVRLALGASPTGVVGLILGSGLKLAVIGALGGLGAALVASRFLSTMLYGTSTFEGTIYATVFGILLVVVGLASYLPARRAARLDPVHVLRNS